MYLLGYSLDLVPSLLSVAHKTLKPFVLLEKVGIFNVCQVEGVLDLFETESRRPVTRAPVPRAFILLRGSGRRGNGLGSLGYPLVDELCRVVLDL